MINFGDSGLCVQYIQNFLKDNYDRTIHLSDEYDKETHKALINYLRLPEILDSYTIKDRLIEKYTFREEDPPNLLIDGGGIWNFDFEITPKEITFYTRDINKCFDGGIKFLLQYIDDINDYCKQNGWYVSSYTSFLNSPKSIENKKIKFTIKQENRKQLLPCKDIINMINFSTEEYLLNKCFLDENNAFHGFIQYSKYYKIAYIKAYPGDTFTISHGYKTPCEMAIAYTEQNLSELKNDMGYVNNIISRMSKSTLGVVNPGEYQVYSIPNDCNCTYLLIQVPYEDIVSYNSSKTTILLGDINLDGKITFDENDENSDYSLLKKYVNELEIGKSSFKLSNEQLIAANLNKDVDINGNPIIDINDVRIFKSQIDSFMSLGTPIDFGTATYEKKLNLTESDNNKLLIIYGDIEQGNVNNVLNIPIDEFQQNPWSIHDEFLSYLLGSTIHKYSDFRDIEWLQEKIKLYQPQYNELEWGKYDEPKDYILNEYFIWDKYTGTYKYYKRNIYTGYILDNSKDLQNGKLLDEETMRPSPISIKNGYWYYLDKWTGQIVLPSGIITKENAQYSLRQIIKDFQIETNAYYKNNSKEQIKFINGYLNPLTEQRLLLILNDYLYLNFNIKGES